MFEFVNFVIKQLQRLKKAMAQAALASFKPDNRSLADVTAMLSALGTAKTDTIARTVALNYARGDLDVIWAKVHQQCVDSYAGMKSVYRTDEASLRAIRRVPIQHGSIPEFGEHPALETAQDPRLGRGTLLAGGERHERFTIRVEQRFVRIVARQQSQ